MPRPETRRSLDEPYVAHALRVPDVQPIQDSEHGPGYTLSLRPRPCTAETPSDTDGVQLEIFPDTHLLVVRSPVFTLACTEVTDVRRSGPRLLFAATVGSRRILITVTRTGTVGMHYRDQVPDLIPWEQDTFDWDAANGGETAVDTL